jgi:hypothetical protein
MRIPPVSWFFHGPLNPSFNHTDALYGLAYLLVTCPDSKFHDAAKTIETGGLLKKALRTISRPHYSLIITDFVPILGAFQQPHRHHPPNTVETAGSSLCIPGTMRIVPKTRQELHRR